MLIYTPTISSRLQYITDYCGKEIIGKPFELTTDRDYYLKSVAEKINYSPERISNDKFWIKPHSLLFENKITEQVIDAQRGVVDIVKEHKYQSLVEKFAIRIVDIDSKRRSVSSFSRYNAYDQFVESYMPNLDMFGSLTQDELFGDANPLGTLLQVGGSRFRVIGVMASNDPP